MNDDGVTTLVNVDYFSAKVLIVYFIMLLIRPLLYLMLNISSLVRALFSSISEIVLLYHKVAVHVPTKHEWNHQ